ncbi:DUF3667 domain-containing protein [Microbulbifer sp. TYP-18]|uniref:DUF3667 domain-containing protein n=1 Tax=Microbulbifer sp. TYP-18 TaxID=3230024 RepID=UPI0034C622E1
MSILNAKLPPGTTGTGREDEHAADLTQSAKALRSNIIEDQKQGVRAVTAACANCGTELLGPHCYQCGQPVKGLVRPFSNIIGDFFDTLLAFDSRIWHTLLPLMVKPGFLTLEYFAGRRMRYVSPVRLFIFLCLTTFFVLRLSTDWGQAALQVDSVTDEFASAQAVEDVERIRDEMIAELEREMDAESSNVLEQGFRTAQVRIRTQAGLRIDELRGKNEGVSLPPVDDKTIFDEGAPATNDLQEGLAAEVQECNYEKCEQAARDSLQISGFDFDPRLSAWLSDIAEQTEQNFGLVKEDPNLFKEAFFHGIPATLLVLLPLFSLLLWFLYMLRRRIYMEHLIVALHSHAFLCFALLLYVGLGEIAGWLGEDWLSLKKLLDLTSAVLLIWMPIYLLLMQKRVYQQRWSLTLVKFCGLGVIYSVLVVVGTSVTAITVLATL